MTLKKCLLFFNFLLIVLVPFKIKATAEFYYGDGEYLYASKNTKDVVRVYVASGKKIDFYIEANTNFYDAVKPITIEVSFKISGNITCSTKLLRSDIYSLSNNMFTLINEDVELTSSNNKIGEVSCTLAPTDTIDRLSNNSLTITIETNDKDFSESNSQLRSSKSNYRFNLGAINEEYLNSLNNATSITSITFDGKTLQGNLKQNKIDSDSTNLKITRNENGNKINLRVENESGTAEEELKSNEKTIPLKIGLNAVSLIEHTNRSLFIEQLETYNKLYGFRDKSVFNQKNIDYSYLIVRADNRSKINTLSTLSITGVSINFNPIVKTYIANVPYNVSSVKIFSTLTDAKSSYVKGYGNRTVNLNEGLNDILIKVKAENESEATYTIKITRDKNGDTTLKSIKVDDKDVEIKSNALKYTINVANEVINPKVIVVANDSRAKVEVEKIPDLIEGSNLVTITVTAQNNMKGIYLLEIIRDTLISTNSNLKTLVINGYELDFDAQKKEYNLKIARDLKQLEINVEPESEKAKYIITGNKDLDNGSIIKIKVTAEDEETVTTYTINIEKDKIESKFSIWFIIIPVLVIGTIIGVFVILKMKNKSLKVVANESQIEESTASDVIETNEHVDSNEVNDSHN